MGGLSELKSFILSSLLFSLICCSLAADPVDNYLLDLGSPTNSTIDTRVFVADNFLPSTVSAPQHVVANTNSTSLRSARDAALYRTAWIFTAPSSFKFPIQQQGRHWIRLYFFPYIFQSFDLKTFKFSVSTDEFVLLNDFQSGNGTATVFKEYLVNITSDQLTLSFTPSSNSSAFISALEVVSVPDDLISNDALTVNPLQGYGTMVSNAFETTFRLNMGGPLVTPSNDTLSRTWIPDRDFLLTKDLAQAVSFGGVLNYVDGGATRDIAPDAVYNTAREMNSANITDPNFNVTWEFDINPSFKYLVRMHFCDIVSDSPNQLYFNVYINSWAAILNFDISQATIQTLAAPVFRDFVVTISDGSSKLRVSVGPVVSGGIAPNAILNGLEIMKLMESGSSSVAGSKKNNTAVIVGVAVGVSVAVIFVAVLCLMCKRRKLEKPQSKTWIPFSITMGSKFSNGTMSTISGLSPAGGFNFSLAALLEATNNFDESWIIGVGGFGKVYKGSLRDGTKVAVKRGNPSSQQGLREFRTEIEMLSNFRHRHLVCLIGYCDERNEMILVYEYMENGTLKNHLYGTDLPGLNWKQRLEICIGSARGLHYLHTGSTKAIIHRDVKSANILLDESFMAKVADFGLSKAGPELDQTHVSTAVKGSFGYLDPEYFRRQQLTEKSDVYSFGVVLLEVICARPVIDPSLPREMVSLAEWGMKWQKKGQLDQIVDPRLAGQIKSEALRKFGDTIEKCLADFGVDRPSMGDVLWNLEYALQLQEALSGSDFDENSMNQVPEVSPRVETLIHVEDDVAERGETEESVDDLSGVSMSKVFSQLVKSEGR